MHGKDREDLLFMGIDGKHHFDHDYNTPEDVFVPAVN